MFCAVYLSQNPEGEGLDLSLDRALELKRDTN